MIFSHSFYLSVTVVSLVLKLNNKENVFIVLYCSMSHVDMTRSVTHHHDMQRVSFLTVFPNRLDAGTFGTSRWFRIYDKLLW